MRRFREDTESTRVGFKIFPSRGTSAEYMVPGTWVPLQEGRLLAERNGVLGKLRPLFDFVPGPISPPQAPKHQTASSVSYSW